ncbi:MAG TPA: hypothetical protein VFA18_03350 [Gemmataceae bacterium]|nr:hypothetical protein [Gemmataceae bacterium]
MQTRDVVGFVLVPLVILFAVLLAEVRAFAELWLVPAIIWMLRLVAYALLVVGGTALLCQSAPGRIPIRVVRIVWLATNGLIILRFAWDVYMPFDQPVGVMAPGRARPEEQAWHYVPDLLGFAIVLLGAFVVPRAAVGRAAPDRVAGADSGRNAGA